MKANRKFKDGEEAVSAVIGVILMVAITVAIAAVVYVYVSGIIGTQQQTAPTLQFTKTDTAAEEYLTVVSADPTNLEWGDLTVLVNGVEMVLTAPSTTVEAGQSIVFDSDTLTQNVDNALGTWTAPTVDYTVTIRHDPTNTLTNEFDFSGP